MYMDIHAKSVDMNMDMDGKFHIHGNPANRSGSYTEWPYPASAMHVDV